MKTRIIKEIGKYSICDVGYCSPSEQAKGCYIVEIIPPITPNPKTGGHDILFGFGLIDIEARKVAVEEATSYIKANQKTSGKLL